MTDTTSPTNADPARFDGQPRGMLINSQRRDVADHSLDGKPTPSLLFGTIRRLLPPDETGAADVTISIAFWPDTAGQYRVIEHLEDHSLHASHHAAREFLEKRLDEIQQKMEIYEHPAQSL